MAAPNPTPGVNQILRSRAYATQGNQTAINIRYWQVLSVTTGGALLSELCAAMEAQLAPHYQNMMVASAAWHGLDLATYTPAPPGIAQISNLAAGPGKIAGSAAPLQVCGVVSLRTAQIGRANRGRLYAPFLGAASIDVSGQANPAYLGYLNALGDNYAGSIVVVGVNGTTNLSPVLWHKKTATWTQLTHYISRSQLGTQRRRGAFGRPNFPPF